MSIKSFLIWITNNLEPTFPNTNDGVCRFKLRTKAADLTLRDARLLRKVLTQVIEELDL